jgi:hypothetical protein
MVDEWILSAFFASLTSLLLQAAIRETTNARVMDNFMLILPDYLPQDN